MSAPIAANATNAGPAPDLVSMFDGEEAEKAKQALRERRAAKQKAAEAKEAGEEVEVETALSAKAEKAKEEKAKEEKAKEEKSKTKAEKEKEGRSKGGKAKEKKQARVEPVQETPRPGPVVFDGVEIIEKRVGGVVKAKSSAPKHITATSGDNSNATGTKRPASPALDAARKRLRGAAPSPPAQPVLAALDLQALAELKEILPSLQIVAGLAPHVQQIIAASPLITEATREMRKAQLGFAGHFSKVEQAAEVLATSGRALVLAHNSNSDNVAQLDNVKTLFAEAIKEMRLNREAHTTEMEVLKATLNSVEEEVAGLADLRRQLKDEIAILSAINEDNGAEELDSEAMPRRGHLPNRQSFIDDEVSESEGEEEAEGTVAGDNGSDGGDQT